MSAAPARPDGQPLHATQRSPAPLAGLLQAVAAAAREPLAWRDRIGSDVNWIYAD